MRVLRVIVKKKKLIVRGELDCKGLFCNVILSERVINWRVLNLDSWLIMRGKRGIIEIIIFKVIVLIRIVGSNICWVFKWIGMGYLRIKRIFFGYLGRKNYINNLI